MRKILISAALFSAAIAAAPVSAQYYGGGYGRGQIHGIQQQVNQIEQRVYRSAQRGLISRGEANRLLRRADRIERLAYRYQRNGLSPREHHELQARVQNLRHELRFERREARRGGRW